MHQLTTRARIFEEYLVLSARLGDGDAQMRLVDLRGPRLLAHAMRLLGDREDARDAVQEAWIDILKGLDQLRDPRAFPAWATRIVTRRCARTIRARQADRAASADLAQTIDHWAEPEGPARAEAAQIRRAIRSLGPDHSSAIALFYLEDMSVAEVATALDIPVGTVKTRLMHARVKLKQALEGEKDD
ncbi:MAG: sigma-70 family RNA polymerase sigma factor [Pseudomonadota bacterium]